VKEMDANPGWRRHRRSETGAQAPPWRGEIDRSHRKEAEANTTGEQATQS